MEKLALEMGYEYLVVDVGRPGGSLLPILGACDIVYMPVKEDGISAARLEELDEYLEMVERPDIQEKIRRVKLPYHNDFGRRETYLEQLLWGELGDYVRQLLKGVPWR